MRFSHSETFDIKPYSEIYGKIHPSRLVACKDHWKHISDRADTFTGKSKCVTAKRKQQIADTRMDKTQRHMHRMNALTHAPQMDDSIRCSSNATPQVSMTGAQSLAITFPGSDIIFEAQRTKPLPKAAAKKRAGAKQVKML